MFAVGVRALLWMICVGMVAAPAGAAGEPSARPNILIILSDDMGFSDLGCYGGEIDTPNLDRLAAGGLRFTQFYNTARCCPTRACLLTGLYPHQAGIGHMTGDSGYDGYRGDLNRRAVTIAEVLKRAGYATYMVGKWHVTKGTQPEGPKDNWPLQRGFDRFYGTITGAGSFFDPGTLTRDNTMISPFADPEYQPEEFYYTHAITDHAIRFLSEHHRDRPEKPFFMYVAYTAAHWPMHALEKDIAKYRGKYDGGYAPIRRQRFERLKQLGLIDPKWELSPQAGDWDKVEHQAWEARCMEVYAAMIDSMDQGIGRIVARLEALGELDNTLILFLQDNGACQEEVGRRGQMPRPARPTLPPIPADAVRTDVIPRQNRAGVPTLMGPNVMPGPEDTYIAYGLNWANVSNTPFREYKHFVHEGGISSPLIVHWSARVQRKGRLEHQPAHLIDLMATCVDVAGASYPREYRGQPIQPMEGVSLVPAFEGKELGRKEPLFWEHEGNRAVRQGRWKLVAKGKDGPWELYDLETDRTEMHNLAAQQPDRVARMAALWQSWAERANVLPLTPYARPRKEQFSAKKQFELSPGADLPRTEAPFVVDRGLTIRVEIRQPDPSGVLVAQGGSAEGYALYLDKGLLHFATRHGGKLTVVAAERPLPEGPSQVTVNLEKSGAVAFELNGEPIGTGQVPGPLKKMPLDGLQVGQDRLGAVGPYHAPHPFAGQLGKVTITLRP